MSTIHSENKAQSGVRTPRLSPDLNELLHMLKALEAQAAGRPAS